MTGPPNAVVNLTTGQVSWTPTTSQLGANAFTIQAVDLAGNMTDQSFSVTAAVVPAIMGIATTTAADSKLDAGSSIPIDITFSEAVNVTGTPQLTLNDGAVVDYASGSGTATLTFTYVVGAGQNTADLDYGSTTALALNGGAIQDSSDLAAILTLPTPGADPDALGPADIVIDTAAPTVAVNSLVTNNNQPTLTGTVTDPAPSSGIDSGGSLSIAVIDASGQTVQTLTGTYTNVVTNADGSVTGTWTGPVSTALADGVYTFQATAADIAGNSCHRDRHRHADHRHGHPQCNRQSTKHKRPRADAHWRRDRSGPQQRNCRRDGHDQRGVADDATDVDGHGYRHELEGAAVTTALSVGTYTVTATATDKAGNVGTASPSATLTITAANSSISGFVYIDPSNKGQREISSGVFRAGLGDVTLTLSQPGDTSFTSVSAVTAADGSYSFNDLAAGTYEITETSPAQYIDGKETAGTPFGGTAGTDVISGIVVVADESGTEYDFSETGLKLQYVSERLFLASTPSTASGLLQQQFDAAPVVQLDGSGGTNYSATFTAGGAAAAVVNNTAATVDHTPTAAGSPR